MTQQLGHGTEPYDPLGRLLTSEEVARRLRVDAEFLRRLARQGAGPPYVLIAKATKRYPENFLVSWMEDNLWPQSEARAS